MLSFVIAARDEDPDVLRRTVDGLRATTPRDEREIVVVDDGSLTPVSGLGTDVHVVRHDQPEGSSRSRRRGCTEASGDVLVSLDAHMSFDAHWLEPVLTEAASGALVCATFCDYSRAETCAWGADLRWSSRRDWASGQFPGLIAVHRRTDPGRAAHDVPAVLGACYLMSRNTYDTLGGWSPLFRVWGSEEADLSARAWKAGLSVRCVPAARVGHLNQVSFRYPVSYDHVELNQLLTLRSLFEHRTIDALERDFAPLSPVVAGWLDGAELAPWRAQVQRSVRVSDREFVTRLVPEILPRLTS